MRSSQAPPGVLRLLGGGLSFSFEWALYTTLDRGLFPCKYISYGLGIPLLPPNPQTFPGAELEGAAGRRPAGNGPAGNGPAGNGPAGNGPAGNGRAEEEPPGGEGWGRRQDTPGELGLGAALASGISGTCPIGTQTQMMLLFYIKKTEHMAECHAFSHPALIAFPAKTSFLFQGGHKGGCGLCPYKGKVWLGPDY